MMPFLAGFVAAALYWRWADWREEHARNTADLDAIQSMLKSYPVYVTKTGDWDWWGAT